MQRRPSPRTVLAIASLGSAVAFIDATIVNIALPNIARSFPGASISTLSWILNAYNIVFAAFLVAAGRIADLLGRRRVFIFGLELFTAGSLLCAIAPSAGTLIAFRMVQALGAAFLVPSSIALVLNAFPAARRSHGVALLSAVGAAAAGLGPFLGGLLVTAANWRLVFLVNLPVGAAGFYGYTLSNVLFLTGLWHYSVLAAGLALTIGPVVAVAVAGPASRLAQRIGPRPVLVAGGLFWGGAVMWFVERVGMTPDFVGEWLPGMVLLGIGAGTLFPNLSGTAVASAPGESFATATGMNSVARQVGAALGVAFVVAIIGTPTPATAHAAFQHAWTFGAFCLFVAGLGCLLVGRVDAAQAPPLTDAARVVLAETEPLEPVKPPRPRPRRMIAPDIAGPTVPRAESAADFLAQTPLFSDINPDLRKQLAAKSHDRHLAAGQWLFREHEPGDAMYVVRAGRLEVVDEAASAVIRELGRGDTLGELALLTDSPRSASVRAARATDVIAIGRADFRELLHAWPVLSLALSRSLGDQLRDTRAPVPTARPRPTTIALIAVDARIPLPRLAARLRAVLEAHLSVAVLSR